MRWGLSQGPGRGASGIVGPWSRRWAAGLLVAVVGVLVLVAILEGALHLLSGAVLAYFGTTESARLATR